MVTIHDIILALNKVSVCGKENMAILYGCIENLEKIESHAMQEPKTNEVKTDE